MKISQRIKFCFRILALAFDNLQKNSGWEMSGYLAFLMILAVFPFTIFLAELIGFVNDITIKKFGESNLLNFVVDFIDNNKIYLPADSLKEEIKKIFLGPPKLVLNIAILGLIWSSSGIIEGLRTVLNRSYCAHSIPHYWRRRLFSIVHFLIISLIIIFTMLVFQLSPVVFSTMAEYLDWLPQYGFIEVFLYIRGYISTVVLTCYVLWLHYFLPNKKLKLKKLIPGAIITVVLWIISSYLLGIYFIHFKQFSIIYGGLANIVAVLLFFYTIFLCFIFGSEFNHALGKFFGNESCEVSHGDQGPF